VGWDVPSPLPKRADNRVFEIDVTQNKVVATIHAGSTPGILAVTPDGSEVWAGDCYATFASVIDIASGAVIKRIPLGTSLTASLSVRNRDHGSSRRTRSCKQG